MYKLAIGVSGGGTTFEAIAKEVKNGGLKMNLAFVFADRECEALKKAKKLNVAAVVRAKGEHINDFQNRITEKLKQDKVDFVALAGYLRLFPIADADPYLVLNSHPAAVPYFGGAGMWGNSVHEAVVNWAKKTNYKYPYTFSTIHIASQEYDLGPAVGIVAMKLGKTYAPEKVAEKLLPLEHKNYIEVLKELSRNLIEYPEYPKEFKNLFDKRKSE